MAKKKKHHKKKSQYKAKHSRKPQVSSLKGLDDPQNITEKSVDGTVIHKDQPQKTIRPQDDGQTDIHVKHEIRHSLGLLGIILVALAILWSLFAHSSFGPYVYHFFKI